MLPKHQSECELEKPFQNTYFDNQFGEKSIGEPKWKPHIRNALDFPDCQQHSIKGGNGLDWFSSIRCPELVKPLEEKEKVLTDEEKTTILNPDNVEEIKLNCSKVIREKAKESTQVFNEQMVEQRLGQRRKVKNVRNGFDERAGGDKSYYVPECSENFHSHGSTLPVASFGGCLRTVPDTFIPLVKLPLQPRIPYHVKEKKVEKINEINEVRQLDVWKPAEPLGFP